MRWFSSWWGVEIIAENDKDEQLLRQLYAIIPHSANESYDDGKLEQDDKTKCKYAGEQKGYVLRFRR